MTLVSRKLKFQFLFSGVVVLVALLVTWIIMSDSSPLYDYFLWHGGLPNTWGMTTLIPYIVSAMLAYQSATQRTSWKVLHHRLYERRCGQIAARSNNSLDRSADSLFLNLID
jgi:hypothetical protein